MVEVYYGRRGPQPLGSVVFEEIEAKAREKLKEQGYESAFLLLSRRFFIIKITNRLYNKQTLSGTLVEVLVQIPPIALIYELLINMGLYLECSSMQANVA